MTTIGHARQAVSDAQARAELYRMWHAGQRMGATHAHILETMGPRTGSPAVETWRKKLVEGSKRRRTVASLVKENSALVQKFEGALLSFGEESGTLEQTLRTLGDHYAAEHRLLLKVWSKLTYPLFTSLVAIIIAPLPLLVQGRTRTYALLVVTGLVVWYGLGGGVIAGLAAQYANRRQFVIGRLGRALASGVESGLPLDRTVLLAAESTGHPEIIGHVRRFPVQVLAGQPMSETFSGCAVIPPEVISAMKVGEMSGDYSGSLRKMAELYDGERG
jgi:type II secretory pathway component PulF